jgi:hypothetical protein
VIAGITEEKFVATIEAKHQRRLMRKKLMALHYVARSSIGIAAGAKSVSSEISFLVEKLDLIRGHIFITDLPAGNRVSQIRFDAYPCLKTVATHI